MRYYLNNFQDGIKQDAVDLMLGRYRPDPSQASPFISPPAEQESFNLFLTKVFVCMVLTFSFLMLVRPRGKMDYFRHQKMFSTSPSYSSFDLILLCVVY